MKILRLFFLGPLFLFIILNLTGCLNFIMAKSAEESKTVVTNLGNEFEPRPNNYPIEIMQKSFPGRDYVEVAELDSHFVFSAVVTSRSSMTEKIDKELINQARLVGGDAVIIKDSDERTVVEVLHTNISSTVIRYK
jgi:hypothetical protein